MAKYSFDGIEYEIEKENKDGYNKDDLDERMTDYFIEFDYIFGDYAYDKLRLKGFYDSKNEKATSVNSITCLDDYIDNYCAYGAKWFLLKKISK